ncbi:MAG: hypothetical protein AAFP08_06200 [Bacteroidota bacterium]
MSPGVANLFRLLWASGRTDDHNQLMDTYKDGKLKYTELKEAVADGLVAISSECRERLTELKADRKSIKFQIKYSSSEIRKRAQATTREVKEICGLANVKM